ncbi:MAG: DUF2442 domain-containing protein [Chitinispirillaceae bacterium]|nr:DUF2442 domain-containing protein [Chitinispirillaceae bacterium]
MNITKVQPCSDYTLSIKTDDGRTGFFDVKPYLQCEAFNPLSQSGEFDKIFNGGYFIEWACGADLSADTIEAKMSVEHESV